MRLKSTLGVRASAGDRLGGPARSRRLGVVFLALFATGCAAAPEQPQAADDPANPRTRVPTVAYRSVVGGYVSQRPVEPGSWREQNERVAPRSGN